MKFKYWFIIINIYFNIMKYYYKYLFFYKVDSYESTSRVYKSSLEALHKFHKL